MAAHAHPAAAPDSILLQDRRDKVASALGTTLAEGVSPGPEVIALSERYVTGEISLHEFGTMVRSMHGR